MRPETEGTVRFICHHELRRRWVEVWDFRGQEGNPHGDGKVSV